MVRRSSSKDGFRNFHVLINAKLHNLIDFGGRCLTVSNKSERVLEKHTVVVTRDVELLELWRQMEN